MGYIRKALEKGYLEHPGSACCTDDMFEIFVRLRRCLRCLLPPFVTRQLPCPHTNSFHGYCFPGCTTETFGAQKGSLWACRVGVGDSASCQAGQETSYHRFTATEIYARVRTSLRLSTP